MGGSDRSEQNEREKAREPLISKCKRARPRRQTRRRCRGQNAQGCCPVQACYKARRARRELSMRSSGPSGIWHGAALGLAATLAVTVLIVLPPAMPSARAQQVRQQNLNPEDVLAPSQMTQPMPAPVSEPRAAPKKKPPERRAAAAKPDAAKPGTAKPEAKPGSAPAHAPRAASVKTVIECKGPFAKDFRHAGARGGLRFAQHDLHAREGAGHRGRRHGDVSQGSEAAT